MFSNRVVEAWKHGPRSDKKIKNSEQFKTAYRRAKAQREHGGWMA
jgi:hypothetical protein